MKAGQDYHLGLSLGEVTSVTTSALSILAAALSTLRISDAPAWLVKGWWKPSPGKHAILRLRLTQR